MNPLVNVPWLAVNAVGSSSPFTAYEACTSSFYETLEHLTD